MKQSARTIVWVVVFLVLALAPLLLLIVGPRGTGREFWREVAVACGFLGLSLMGVHYVLTARLPALADVYPLDVIYYFHHQLALISLGLVLAHPVILFINNPNTLRLLNLATAPLRARAGVVAAIGVTALVYTSVRRQQLGINYERWRLVHGLLSLVSVGLALYHILNVGHHTGVPAQRVLWGILGAMWLAMLLYVRVVKPLRMLRKPYRVVEVKPERGQSWTLTLAPDAHEGLRFQAGQFAWLTLGQSPFLIREHPFSFSSSEHRPERLSFAIRELGDFSSRIGSVPVGTVAYLDGPYGVFSIDQFDAPGYAFLVGGIGISPVMSMLRTLADREDPRRLWLFYGNQTWDYVAFREELDELADRMEHLQVVHVLERPPEGWEGETGFITAEMLDRYLPEDRADLAYFICGPIPMIRAVEPALRVLGVPLDRIHSERYEMA